MVTEVKEKQQEELLGDRGKAVVVLSGGVDSTTLLYDVKHLGYEAHPITFFYGQKHDKELEAAWRTCQKLGLERRFLDINALGDIAPSALTRGDVDVPKAGYDEESMKQTVVPNRNMVLISLATAYAIGIEANWLFFGSHRGDHAIYPDCRPAFMKAMEQVISLCDYHILHLRTPYLYWSKVDILKRGLELGVDYSLTWSCYEGKDLACGECGTCQERLGAFKEVGMKDPIRYRSKKSG